MSTRGKQGNRTLLIEAAKALRPVLNDLVFVGGCATALLITDEAAGDVRPTYDVDAVVEAASYAQYTAFSERLRELGFKEDSSEGAPICRWRHKKVVLDVMPTDESILGFSNRWYRQVIRVHDEIRIAPGLTIKIANAPYFVATKLEAFKGRGIDDLPMSKDLEDLIAVLDGRASVPEEIECIGGELTAYIGAEFNKLLDNPDFVPALPAFLAPDGASQGRLPILLHRIRRIASL